MKVLRDIGDRALSKENFLDALNSIVIPTLRELRRAFNLADDEIDELDGRVDALESGGGGGMTFDSPVALTPGGANVDGVDTDAARADHEHELPDFGTTAGTFCEGNDSRLSNDRTASGLRSASTVVSVSSATAPSAGQILAATSSTAAEWQDVSSVVLDSLTKWEPDSPPASPHASDDECEDNNTTGWSEWDVTGNTTLTGSATLGAIYIEKTNTAGNDWSGMYKAVPAVADYSVTAKVSLAAGAGGGVIGGLMLADDLGAGPTTADFKFISIALNTTDNFIQTRDGTAYNAAGTTTATRNGPYVAVYLRVRVTGTTTAAWDYSPDGVSWIQVRSAATTFTPVHMGFCILNNGGITARLIVHWFRVVEATPSLFDTIGARLDAAYIP